jgi:hypothetical protein
MNISSVIKNKVAPVHSNVFFQPKLKIGQPGDKYEQEADSIANRMMRMSSTETMQMQPLEEEEEMIQMQPVKEQLVQMKCRKCEEEEMLQTKSGSGVGFTSPNFSQQIQMSKGRGTTLSEDTNRFMSNSFGTDFSQVNIHTGTNAVQMNQQLGARAFTHGNDIYFNSGEYQTESENGKRLLAHELTHTIQQGSNVSNNIQCDFAVEPVNVDTEIELTDDQIRDAIRYNSYRFFDEAEIRLVRDVLGISKEPAIIDEDFVVATARYQHLYGETVDGKIGADSSLTLAIELLAEGLEEPSDEMFIRSNNTQSVRNIDSGGRNDIFDAELDHGNTRLTLRIRVNFNFVAGGGGAWPDVATQESWVEDYIRVVQSAWSYKLLMERIGDSDDYLKYYATRVVVEESNRNPHYTVNVSNETGHTGSSVSNAANTVTLDSFDTVNRHRVRHGNEFDQFGAAHEFGHMIGLDHIACDNNSDACYGGANRNVRRNIMGSGSAVTTANSTPFVTAMREITGQAWNAIRFRRLV